MKVSEEKEGKEQRNMVEIQKLMWFLHLKNHLIQS